MREHSYTARAKAKYAHNHVTAESAQPRNRSKCARPSPVLWVGSGHETSPTPPGLTYRNLSKCFYVNLNLRNKYRRPTIVHVQVYTR